MLGTSEQRRAERKISHFKSIYPIVFFEDPGDIATIEKKAEVVDISETGMGLFTQKPLKVGRRILLKQQRNWKLPESAVVIWSLKHENGYRVGIKFFA